MTSSNSEFGLIARLFAPLATSAGALGLKDDAAIIAPRPGHDLVVTTDMIVSGVDFFPDDPAPSVAKKALRVNLSDLAAKGAQPFAYLLDLALPRDFATTWLESFVFGLRDDQARFGIGLLGGDLSGTPGPLSITITAFGHVPQGRMIARKGARPGDLVFVTGTIGDGGGGLALLRGESGENLNVEQRNALIERYRVPEPPVAFGPSLLGLATAALDVSDGLIADLGHVAEVCGVRIVVDGADIPRSDALTALWGDDFVRAAVAGDDYQIAFTAGPGRQPEIERAARDAGTTQVTRIGRVEPGSGVLLLNAAGREVPIAKAGFTHF